METEKEQGAIYSLLLEEKLEAFYTSFRSQLHVYKVEDLLHVTRKDLSSIGILSGPDIRRFEKVIGKVTKNAGLKGIFTKVLPKKQKQLAEIPATVSLWEEFEPVIIKAEDLILKEVLGAGNFGEVHKGEWIRRSGGHETAIPVAVKCLKEESNQSFIKEVSVLSQLDQKHDNIIKLYGISIQEDVVKMVTEYAEQGSLLEKLLEGEIRMISLLCQFAVQIASGMMYLEQKGLVHRDLAARNILITAHNQVKISDFGLAKLVGKENQWVMTAMEALPIRWMALESLLEGKFTSASDVWSFGVVLWEMFSFGEHPWGSCSSKEVIDKKKTGGRLPEPDYCPSNVYSIVMMRCWAENPGQRINFEEARKSLISVHPTSSFAVSSHHQDEGLQYSFGDAIVALKPIDGNPDLWLGQNERTLEFGNYIKSATHPVQSKIPSAVDVSLTPENERNSSEKTAGNLQPREHSSRPINIPIGSQMTSHATHHVKQPAGRLQHVNLSEIEQPIPASSSPKSEYFIREFSPPKTSEISSSVPIEPIYSSIDEVNVDAARGQSDAASSRRVSIPSADKLASGTAKRYPSMYVKMKLKNSPSQSGDEDVSESLEDQKPALPPKMRKREQKQTPKQLNSAITCSVTATPAVKSSEGRTGAGKVKPKKPPRVSKCFYFDDAFLHDSEQGRQETSKGIYENRGVFVLDPTAWAENSSATSQADFASNARSTTAAASAGDDDSGETKLSNMMLKLHIPYKKQNSFERMKKLRKTQSLESINIEFPSSYGPKDLDGYPSNVQFANAGASELDRSSDTEDPFATSLGKVSYKKLESDAGDEMGKKRSLFGIKLRRKSRKEHHPSTRPTSFLQLFNEIKEALPGSTQPEAASALEISNWSVEEAIRYLKMLELLKLGLCPEDTCLDILKTYDWNVLEASYAIKIHYLMAIHLDLSLEEAAKLLRQNHWDIDFVVNKLKIPSYFAECESIGVSVGEADKVLASVGHKVDEALCKLKVKRVADITRKPEDHCRRTLEHCQWKVDRAVTFIIESTM